ncbi:hypothetical protein Stsp01_25080 [Streptomyces sp. NBRC 13847]|nr:hypothetical protein Stsp01_25080 [Streptomyces sp. NBRC 13847]
MGTSLSVPYGSGAAQPGAGGGRATGRGPIRMPPTAPPTGVGIAATVVPDHGARGAPADPAGSVSRAVASCRRYWEKKVVSRVFVQVIALVQGTG